MNEEELRIEATTTVEWECTPMIDRPTFINGYITSAKPREKQIHIDAEHILALQKQNGELTDKVKELEAQIEQLVYLHNEDVNTIKLLNEQIAELKRDKQNLRADLRTARNNLQAKDTAYQLVMEELNYAKTHCLFHSNCPTQKENTELKDNFKIAKDNEYEYQSLFIKAKELLRDVLPYIDLTDCVNSDPRLILYDKIKSLINEE